MTTAVTTTAVIQVKPGIGDTIWQITPSRLMAVLAPNLEVLLR